jgi:Alternative complex III, ActD subunit
MPEPGCYGLLAEFETPEALIAAAERTREAGYRDLDAFTPFPVYELQDVFNLRDRRVLWLGLFGGLFGFVLALGMQLFTNYDYPINVGGRPLYALSAFMVVCFELTVLFAALMPAIGMLALNGLPRLNHPIFAAPAFYRASRDRFFLCVLASDAKFDAERTSEFLRGLDPASIELVEA